MTKEKRAFEVGQRVVVARSLPKDGDHWYGEAPLDARRGKVVRFRKNRILFRSNGIMNTPSLIHRKKIHKT